jgi:hypothetical protein
MSSTLKLSAETPRVPELPPGLSDYAQRLTKLEKLSRRGETIRIAPPPFDELSDEAARAVLARWNRPCEGAFELLAARFPHDLVKLIEQDRLEPSDLTFAAEALGRSNIGWLVRRALKPLLRHASAVVREGAIYGLQKHLNAEVRAALASVVNSDASPAVRNAAEDALSDP